MGILFCCFRFREREDEHDSVSGFRVSHYQSSVSNNLMLKSEEVLRSDQQISSSHKKESTSNFGNDFLLSSNTLSSSRLGTLDGHLGDISNEEDVCPTCFEDYTDQNPKIFLQCGHIFHLSCIYEWMERSEACPFCAKMMLFLET